MINIDKKSILELREITQVGFLDCKKALEKSGGVVEKAIEIINKDISEQKNNRDDRETNNGRVFMYNGSEKCILIELTCETYSVSINSKFISTGEKIVQYLADNKEDELDENVTKYLNNAIAIIKENITIQKYISWPKSNSFTIKGYIHHNSKMGVIAKFKTTEEIDHNPFKEFADIICMNLVHYRPDSITAFNYCINIHNSNLSINEYVKEFCSKTSINTSLLDFEFAKVGVC